MYKSERVQIRLSAELLTAIDAQAEADGMTRTTFIVNSCWTRLANAPTLDGSNRAPKTKPTNKALKVVASIPNVTTAAQLPQPTAYQRPKHAGNCHCYICRPPKES